MKNLDALVFDDDQTVHHHRLSHSQALSLTPTQPECLHVLQGRVWLTLAGDSADYVLSAGECFQLPANKHAVLEAWGQQKETCLFSAGCT